MKLNCSNCRTQPGKIPSGETPSGEFLLRARCETSWQRGGVLSRVMCRLLSVLCFITLTVSIASEAGASPIFVYKEKDGTVRFTSRRPPSGVTAKVFTAKSSRYSVYRGNYSPVRLRSPFRRSGGKRIFKELYKEAIHTAAMSHRLDPALIKAVIHVESAFNPSAVSPKGAIGLMQLMPGTARGLGVRKPFLPEENIRGGSKHLAKLLKKYDGNVKLALAAYNAGEEAVRKHKGIPPYPETRQYVARVLQMRAHYSTL
jgi:soluble lytic murein transglycosylase-like protein